MLEACDLIKKEASIHVFTCEFGEIFMYIFFNRTPPATASGFKFNYCTAPCNYFKSDLDYSVAT